MNVDIEKIEELAKAATPGPWWIDSHGHAMVEQNSFEVIFTQDDRVLPAKRHEDTGNLSHWRNDNDASYLAAVDPTTILSIIHRLRTAESERDALLSEREQALKQEPYRYERDGLMFTTYDAAADCDYTDTGINELYLRPIPVQPSPAVAVPDVAAIIGKLNHVLKMNADVMTTTGVVYIEQVIAMLSTPTPQITEQKQNEWEQACHLFLMGCSCSSSGCPEQCDEHTKAFCDRLRALAKENNVPIGSLCLDSTPSSAEQPK